MMGIGPKIVNVSTGTRGQLQMTVMGRLPHSLNVDVLSRVSPTKLLVSTYPKHEIFLFDTTDHRFRLVHQGWNAVYFPALKAFVFLNSPKGEFMAQELWIAPLAHPDAAKRLDRGPFPIPMPVVPIAPNAFVYSSWRKTGKQRLWLYNMTFGTYIPLHISGVYPELWLPHSHLLLCVNLAKLDRPYSFRSLNGKIVSHLSLGNWYTPALALPHRHIVLVGRQGEAMSSPFTGDTLMAYALKSKHLRVVLQHTFVGLGTIVQSGGKG
ncbi:MAG: hypothetical protein M1574_05405 [Gammaproteobacteria bacterium]|nr:hypothetical protein [Gammaproteobacteria bacterium]